ncbi:MAG TPA: hypothetical protein VLL52_07430, partial [Anaerolineae bacterium]|nr:hypothetical protein [Anaerolineae bacterium]
GHLPIPLTITYYTTAGTATPYQDYTPITHTITLPPGTNYQIPLAIPLGHPAPPHELPATIYLHLLAPPNANLTTPLTTIHLLNNQDITPQLYLPITHSP